ASFLQDGVHFAFGLEEIDGGGLGDHLDDPRAAAFVEVGAGLEVAGGAAAEVGSLADIEDLVVGIFHKVQAGGGRKGLDGLPYRVQPVGFVRFCHWNLITTAEVGSCEIG